MRKLLSLLVCMMLLIAPAYAAEDIPAAVPSQGEFEESFFSAVNQFISSTDLSENALKMDVSASGQPVVNATLEADGDVLNAGAVVTGTPVQLRFDEESIYAYAGGQSYFIPYSNLNGILSELTGIPISAVGSQTIMRFYDAVYRHIITPGVTVEETDESRHVVFDLNEKMLLALGDEIVEDPELRAALSSLPGDTDISETWASLHGMLESGQFPITLHADIRSDALTEVIEANGNIGGVPVSVNIDKTESGVAFSVAARPFLKISGAADHLTGEAECHVDAAGVFSFDVSCTRSDGFLHFMMKAEAGTGLLSAVLDETEDSFNGSFACNYSDSAGEAKSVQGQGRFEKATGILTGQVTLPDNRLADLNGAPAENGYRISLTVSQDDVTTATAVLLVTGTEAVSTVEIRVDSQEQTVFTGEFNYARQTGAFSTQYDAMGVRSMEGNGMITPEESFGTLTFREGNAVNTVLAFSRVNNSDTASLSFTADALSGDSMSRVFTLSAEYDKISGSFAGTCWIPQNYNRLEIQWVHDDSVWRLKALESKIGSIDATFLYDGSSLMGEFTGLVYGAGGSVTGNFLWSPYAKTLSLTTQLFRMNVSLVQNGNGMPIDLKGTYQETRRPVNYEIKINRDELYFSKNGRVTTISGAFKDEHTCSVTVTQNAGRLGRENHFIAEFRADPDLLQIEVTDDTGEKLFEASLYHAEKGGMEFLYDEENAVELTPELADSILHGIPEETVSQAEAVITE